jgi:hypothetical protein
LARLLKRGKGKKDGKDGTLERQNSQYLQHSEPRQQQQHPVLPRVARWAGGLFGPVLLVLFVGLDFLLKSKDPVFGYPLVLLDKPFPFYILMALPYLLAALGLLMLVFTVLAWARRYWTWTDRLHYTVLTFSALPVLWGMWYWNLLF